MANSRPVSMIIPPGVFDEPNTNNISKEKPSKLPGHSSSSSIDSNSINNVNLTERNSVPLINITTTTTDSDLESEQDDNLQTQQQKNDRNSQEHLPGRLKTFKKLFKSEIGDEMPDLIDSYVCAYQGDILLQGKMYITDRYLCFHSRIINYVTKHVYRWEEIQYITKERVAFIFPTAIGVQLKNSGKKVTYASFIQRDQAFEKIQSIWVQFTNDTHSYDDDDDDENYLEQNGTLKANHNNEKTKYSKRHSYEIIHGPEQDDVLQMYLKKDKNSKKPRLNSLSSKSSEEKRQVKQRSNSYNKKPSAQNYNLEQKSSNGLNENISNINQPIRRSRYSKNDQKQPETSKRNTSAVNHRSQSSSVKPRQSLSRDRTLSSTNQTLSHTNSSSNPVINTNSSVPSPTDDGIMMKILLTFVSVIKLTTHYILSFLNYFKIYPIKTTIILLLFLTILFFHSFYLIKLAYQIEDRLRTLHHIRPSSPSIKNSFSSSKEL